ncbi:MAG TPA: hypothetical protein VME43_21870 [Bryobacteraceae bacterium]|nr:hypothetical protein [Bryobacteraceae bacterium]
MTITVDIKPEVQAEITRQTAAHGSAIETYAASLLEEVAHVPPAQDLVPVAASGVDAYERLKTFGKRHGLSLGGLTFRELRHEARPWGHCHRRLGNSVLGFPDQ